MSGMRLTTLKLKKTYYAAVFPGPRSTNVFYVRTSLDATVNVPSTLTSIR